ncbi:MAG: restriction endonuclease subunit S [Phycisphaerae bacterium]
MSFRMSVPSHWRTELLDDLCDKITDGTHHSPSETDQTQHGDFAYVTAKNIKEAGIDLSRITYLPARIHNPIFERCNPEKGDVLYIKDGVTTGIATVNQLDEPFSMLSSVALLKPKRRVVEPRFLKWYLNSPIGYSAMTSQMTGTAIKRLTLTKIKEAWAPVAPLSEQRRIVAKIEELFSDLDAGVAALERVRANLKRYRAAVLKAAVEGHLTEEWRKQHPPPHTEPAAKLLERILAERRAKWEQGQLRKFKEAGKTPPKGWKEKYEEPAPPATIGDVAIPMGWSLASLEQLTSAVRVICYGILMPKDHVPGGIPYVKVRDMRGDRLDPTTLQRTTPEIAAQFARASLKGGDLLLAIRGTYGRAVEIPPELEGGNITQDSARLDVSGEMDHQYVLRHLRSIDTQNYFKRVARGVAVKGVNIGDVRPTPILVPPLAEQAEIVAEVDRRLSVADAAEQQVEHALQRAARLRQSILKRAFEGKLVPQDPADEPAATMLERAKAPTNGHRTVIQTSDTPRRDTPKRRSRARV